MWLFLIVLILLGFVHTAINLSLVEPKRFAVVTCVILGVISFALYHFAIKLNIQRLDRIVHAFNTLSSICVYQIIEAVVCMLLSLILIRSHYSGENVSVAKYLALLPSGILLGGIFFGQTYLLNMLNGFEFYQIAFIFAVTVFFALWATSFLARKIFYHWAWRMEFKIIVSFLQVLIAMFLPLIVMGIRVNDTRMAVSVKATIGTLGAMMLISAVGYVVRTKFLQGRN